MSGEAYLYRASTMKECKSTIILGYLQNYLSMSSAWTLGQGKFKVGVKAKVDIEGFVPYLGTYITPN